jgi:hypothetical protein
VYVHPDELKGIATLWKIIAECANLGVIAECIVFISAIFHNVSDLISDQKIDIEDDLVNKCISQIDILRKAYNEPIPEDADELKIKMINYKKEYMVKQIERFLLHIRSFIENSERHGIDHIMVFKSMAYFTPVTLVVNNKISWGLGCYNNK